MKYAAFASRMNPAGSLYHIRLALFAGEMFVPGVNEASPPPSKFRLLKSTIIE